MKARVYLDQHGFEGYQGEWFTSIMESFANQKNKELIDINQRLERSIEAYIKIINSGTLTTITKT